ncbi:MAG: hypothetical protein K2L94_02990 [Alphaproteobacteria bacterium]|nr:hypothetical protein [Alphaproteobacteria bacterium]
MPTKILFAAIAINLLTSTSLFAVTSCVTCTNASGSCASTGPTCCAPCYSSGGGTVVTGCPDDCPGTLYTQIDGTNIEARCVTSTSILGGSTKKCEYRCMDGYFKYDGGLASINGRPTCNKCPTLNYASCTSDKLVCKDGFYYYTRTGQCATCPSNATCTDGMTFACSAGYYRASTAAIACTQCPYDSMTSRYGTTASTGSTAVSQCYIPESVGFSDDTGEWEYTNKCVYAS